MARKEKRTLQAITHEIEKLQAEAEAIREAEKAEVVSRIKEAVAHYHITAADLGLSAAGGRGRKAKGKPSPKVKAAAAVKYKDEAGHTWSGRGRKPGWFVDALAAGKTEADLRA